jgi:hypothetical protein
MNDTMSLLLATGILAVGGLGLFMYKSGSPDKSDNENYFDFDLKSFFGNSNNKKNEDDYEDDYNENDDDDEDEEPEVYEPPKRSRGSKTKSTRKSSGTKRRY